MSSSSSGVVPPQEQKQKPAEDKIEQYADARNLIDERWLIIKVNGAYFLEDAKEISNESRQRIPIPIPAADFKFAEGLPSGEMVVFDSKKINFGRVVQSSNENYKVIFDEDNAIPLPAYFPRRGTPYPFRPKFEFSYFACAADSKLILFQDKKNPQLTLLVNRSNQNYPENFVAAINFFLGGAVPIVLIGDQLVMRHPQEDPNFGDIVEIKSMGTEGCAKLARIHVTGPPLLEFHKNLADLTIERDLIAASKTLLVIRKEVNPANNTNKIIVREWLDATAKYELEIFKMAGKRNQDPLILNDRQILCLTPQGLQVFNLDKMNGPSADNKLTAGNNAQPSASADNKQTSSAAMGSNTLLGVPPANLERASFYVSGDAILSVQQNQQFKPLQYNWAFYDLVLVQALSESLPAMPDEINRDLIATYVGSDFFPIDPALKILKQTEKKLTDSKAIGTADVMFLDELKKYLNDRPHDQNYADCIQQFCIDKFQSRFDFKLGLLEDTSKGHIKWDRLQDEDKKLLMKIAGLDELLHPVLHSNIPKTKTNPK